MKNSKLLLGLSGLFVLVLQAGPSLAATAGYTQFVMGQVTLTTAGGASHALQKGEAINEGDTISTSRTASAQIRMQDGGFVAVRPDTQLKFDSFVFSGKAGAPERSFFSLFRGGFRAVTGLIGRIKKQDYRITTPVATIGVRGTDHESIYLPAAIPGALAGAYSKVNIGETSLTTNRGTINVLPNQMGFAGGLNQAPQLQPINTVIFTVAAAPTKTIKESKEARKEGDTQKPQVAADAGNGKPEESKTEKSEAVEPVRAIAVVDNTKLAENVRTTAPSTSAAPESKTETESLAAPKAPAAVLSVKASSGSLVLDITEETVKSGNTTVSIEEGIYSVQAQTAADAAQVAANAANAAKVAATSANTTLQAIATVDTAPATTAKTTASSTISTATPLVTAALALPSVSAGTTPATAQNKATTAVSQTSTAVTAFAANGAFADSTAAPAKTATETANTALQSANTALQTAATTVTTRNTALTNAKTAANAALVSANSNLTTATSNLATANTQNNTITTAQSAASALLSTANAAASAANTAALDAQAAADQAAALQAAGDLTGAAAQLVIAQNQLAIAQTKRASALTAQTSLATKLANAQTAYTSASTAVTTSLSAANDANTAATTAQTQAANANTDSSAANTALATVTSQSPIVNTNAATVAANAPIAAYNNPNVVTPNRFIGVLKTVVAPAANQYIEGGGPGDAFTGVGTANTSFVLDGSGNLVESRHTWYEESAASTATTQVIVPDANVKRTGGTAVQSETFKLTDSSIYGGRWTGGSITVTDNATAVAPFTRNFGATSEHWAIVLAPTAGYVQALTGTTAYTKVAATSPTDASGTAGVLNTATLSANFTSQLVSAALNLTISGKTLDVQALNMAINGFGFSSASAISPTCTGCATTYYAYVGGMFAGDAAASAGVSYTLWTGAAPGATTSATDLIQGLVAFNTATPPTLQAFDVAAQTAATAAAAAATAAQTAATTAGTANTTLTGIAPVSTTPATTAIGTATTDIGSATTAVGVAAALSPADATAAANNATAAAAAAADAAALAVAAQNALTLNGTFADATATPANTTVQSANTTAQTAKTAVESNATAVITKNSELSTAQTAATTALADANTSLSTANTTVGTVAAFNSTITAAQAAAATSLSAAQTAATAAQAAATAAQAAATQAATLQAGGDLVGAQQQLAIAQEQLAIAQTEQTNAQTKQAAVAAQLTSAQAALASGNTAVADATTLAGTAAASAVSAQTLATAAGTAATAASNALNATVSQLALVNSNATTVAANAPIAAYNNPAVVSNNFMGHLTMPAPATPSGYNIIANEINSPLQSNTQFVLDGNGSLVEMRDSPFEIRPVQSAAITSITNANVKWSGGTDADTFKLADNSIYGGRWVGATVTVTDLATVSPVAPFSLTPANSLWAVVLPPATGYVPTLIGTTSYTEIAATQPFDAAGHVGTLTSATLTADFTSQLVNAALNLTMPAASSMAGTYAIASSNMPIDVNGGFGGGAAFSVINCTGTCAATGAGGYSANVGGTIAGTAAASAALGYDIWPTVTAGSPVTDLVQGLVAFTADTTPSGPTYPAAGNWFSYVRGIAGTTGAWQRAGMNNNGTLPNTSFVLDGAGNLVKLLNDFYIERYEWNSGVPAAVYYPDATIVHSGGAVADRYQLPDGSLTIGRWEGGQLIITDNTSVQQPQLVKDLGATSMIWGLASPVPGSISHSLIGTASYTMQGATLPTDSFGHTGSITSASVTADFTRQTADASVSLSIFNQNLTSTATAVPFNYGDSIDFYAADESGLPPIIICTGTGCSGVGYSGVLSGVFVGDAAAGLDLKYRFWPTASANSLVVDVIQGAIALSSGTAPTIGSNPPAGDYVADFVAHVPVGDVYPGYTMAWSLDNPAMTETSILLDGSGNMVRLLGATFEEPGAPNSPPLVSISDATLTWSGGTAAEKYQTSGGSIIFGRWQGGSLNVTDNSEAVAPFSISLAQTGGMAGPASSLWLYGNLSASTLVQSLIGTTTYIKTASTAPFDSLGNTGTLDSATLEANFTNQLVSATLGLTINSLMFGVNATMPIGAFDPSGFETSPAYPATVTCGACSFNYKSAGLGGAFAGTTASDAVLGYGIALWDTLTPYDAPASNIISGYVAFNTATPPTIGPAKAYTPNHVAVETAGQFGFGEWILANPADLVYVPGGTSTSGALTSMTFRDFGGGSDYVSTTTISGGTATSADAANGIEYGQWSDYTGISQNFSWNLGGSNEQSAGWMYGPEGYLELAYQPVATSLSGAMAATFTYQLDGATAPKSMNTLLTGTLTGATLTADFIAMTVSANLALTMPGSENWAASMTAQPISGINFGGQLTVDYGLGVTPVVCATCGGYLNGMFTGQNYAGAILSYDVYADFTNGGDTLQGDVALSRNYTGNSNPVVTNGGTAPTGNIVVASSNSGVNTYPGANVTTTGNLLTSFGLSGGGFSSTNTVTCVSCTTNPSGQVATSGIYYGTWDEGTYSASFNNTFPAGVLPPSYWITGPEAGPLYLPEALTGTASYIFNAGQVTNSNGAAGIVEGTTTLALDFNMQAVGINLDVSIADTATTPVTHAWNAKTLPGDEALLTAGMGLGGGVFRASSNNNGNGSGLLTVTVDNGTTPATIYNADINGQLTGVGLNGAIMSFGLSGLLNTTSPTFESINGVAAFTGTAKDVATAHRYVGIAFYEPFAAVPQPLFGFYANNSSRITQNGTGNLTQFDMLITSNNGGNSSMTFANNTATLTDHGTDATSGISWGRWAGGTFNATDRVTGSVTPVTNADSLHWIAESAATAATTLPLVGTYTYVNAGGTTPTDNTGVIGTLNSATLTADFTAHTVNMGVNVTVAGATLDAVANNAPIIQRTGFYASSQEPPSSTSHLAVTCSGGTACSTTLGGSMFGKFTGANAIGAVMTYGLQNGNSAVSGVAAFHQ